MTDTTQAPETPEAPGNGRKVRSMIVATGAAVGMTLAGLGIANAQVAETTTSAPPPAAGSAADNAAAAPTEGHPGHPRLREGIAVAARAIGISEADLVTAVKGGQSVAQVAQAHNVAPQAVVDALVAAGKEHLAAAVAAGRITQAQSDARAARLPEMATAFVNHVRSADDPGPRGGPHPGMKLAAAATTIGISEADLVTAIRGGQSIAQVAQAHNVAPQAVVDALVAAAKEHLAAAVAAGRITQAQSDARAADLPARMTELVNHVGPGPRMDGRGPGGRRGPGRPADADAAGVEA